MKVFEPKKWRLAAAVIAIGAILVGLIGSHAFAFLKYKLLVATFAAQPLSLLAMVFIAARLRYLAGPHTTLWSAAKAQSLAILVLYLLPSRMSELIKPLYLADHCQVRTARAFAAVMCERISDILILAIMVIVTILCFSEGRFGATLPYWIAIVAGILVLGGLFIARPHWFRAAISYLPSARLLDVLTRLLENARSVLTPRRIPATMAMGALGWAFSFGMTYVFLLTATSKSLSVGDALIVFLASSVGLAVGVAPGGLGTYEGAIILALGLFGYSMSESLVLAVGMRISAFALPGTIAFIALANERTGIRTFISRIRDFWRQGIPSQESGGGAG